MGVQITMAVDDQKHECVATTIAPGEATFPPAGHIGIVNLQAAEDLHRDGDVQRAIRLCYRRACDDNRLVDTGAVAYVTTLDGGKDAWHHEGIAANLADGDVGVMFSGVAHGRGERLDIEEAFRRIVEWARENGRLFN